MSCKPIFHASLLVTSCALLASAGEIVTKEGFAIQGTPLRVSSMIRADEGRPTEYEYTPYWMVDDGMRRIFVSSKTSRVPKETINQDAVIGGAERFELEHITRARAQEISSLGTFKVTQDLDEHGRMIVQILTSKGPLDVVLGITEITPQFVKFESIVNYKWEFCRAPTSFPANVLTPLIYKSIDPTNRVDRMAVARFFMETRQFHHAQGEIIKIKQDFPDLQKQLSDLQIELNTVQANQLLRDLRARQEAGQHELAVLATRKFPTVGIKPEVLQQIREIEDAEQKLKQKVDDAILLLGNLQSELADDALKREVEVPRMEITRSLDKESVSRLQPFLDFYEDESLSAEEKFALAFSGWMLGDQNARTDFKVTMSLWNVRLKVLDYLRNKNPVLKDTLLQAIATSEGVAPETIAPMLEHLPPAIETPGLEPGKREPQLFDLETVGRDGAREYSAMLPIEYTPHHAYPMILALRPAELSRQAYLTSWWLEQASRRGYIVVCPEYFDQEKPEYDYSVQTHLAIQRAMRDAMKRFHVDPERIYLAGHGIGGDGAFDFGMAHSDLFAGVISISGRCDYHCQYTWENDPQLAVYAVGGELDTNLLAVNNQFFGSKMIRYGGNGIYVEYKGRGYERYLEEIHRLFDWMELHRKDRKQTHVKFDIVRPTDNRLYWLEASGLPQFMYENNLLDSKPTKRIITLESRLTSNENGQRIYIKGGHGPVTLWLSPDFFDFDQRLTITGTRKGASREFVQPEVEVMLEDYRERADRKNLAWAKIVLK